METKVQLRRYQNLDVLKIAEFRRSFPGPSIVKVDEPIYHEWKCSHNTVQQGYIWLAEDNGKIVATASMTPKRLNFLGETIMAAETGDTFTLPEYQGRGIFTKLVKNTTSEAIKEGVSFIYGTPNSNSLPGYRSKLDYEIIPSLKLLQTGRPINLTRVLENKYGGSRLVTFLSFILGCGSELIFKVANATVAKSNISISQVASFPDDIDDLWKRASKYYEFILVRDKKYLNWRFVEGPDHYLILIARNQSGNILGYIVGKIYEGECLRTGYIADFLTLENDSRIFLKLLLHLINIFRNLQVDNISAWVVKDSLYYRVFKRVIFRFRAEIPVICYKNEFGNRILLKSYRFHFTLGDSDNI